MLRAFTVCKVGQIDGLETDVATVPGPEPLPERLECARAFVPTPRADVRHGFDGAWYVPGSDFLALPDIEAFVDPASFSATVFHQLRPLSGADTRPHKALSGRLRRHSHAADELDAALPSALLSSDPHI